MKHNINQAKLFVVQSPDCFEGNRCAGQCDQMSRDLLKVMKKATLIRVSHFKGKVHPKAVWRLHPAYWHHTAVLSHGMVFDVTARQFDPTMNVPRIVSLEQFQEEWLTIKIGG